MTLPGILLFIGGSIIFILFTWRYSIVAKRPHGIPRLFAFECILLLTVINVNVWFKNPLSWNQIISWIFLSVSIAFAVSGFVMLSQIGRPQGDFENTTKLVIIGIYKYIRHPLYSSLIFLGTGVFLKHITLATIILALINIIALIATAKWEEKEMMMKFGVDFTTYMQKTKMFIPFVF